MGIGLAIAGVWSAIGAATIGSIAVGALLQGALIGAAIGGISAAVTGGSIGKGILFGAIGGAVTGGLGSYLSGAGGTGWVGGQTAVQAGFNSGTEMGQIAAQTATKEAGKQAINQTVSAGLSDIGKEVLAQGVVAGVGGYMESEANKDSIAGAKEAATIAHERNKETMRLASELSQSNASAGVDNTGAELAYKARMSELDQRKEEFGTQTEQTRLEWDTEMARREGRRSLFSNRGATNQNSPMAPVEPGGQSLLEKRQDNVQVDTVQPVTALGGTNE